jgi:hypothetical protein
MKFIAILSKGAVVEIRQVNDDDILSPETLPVVFDALPVFDGATQKIVRGTPVVGVDSVRVPWVVSALTPDELAAIAEKASDRQFRESIDAAIAKLDAGTATAAEIRGYLAKVLRWIQRSAF